MTSRPLSTTSPAVAGSVASDAYSRNSPSAGAGASGEPEEVAIMQILRLLNQVQLPGTLSPVERAFVEGAHTIFTKLSSVCVELLGRPAKAASSTLTPPGKGAGGITHPADDSKSESGKSDSKSESGKSESKSDSSKSEGKSGK
jgi:hypothetical protein